MAIYVPEDNNGRSLRIGGTYANFGDIVLIRTWESSYDKSTRGTFRVGPVGSVDPSDFRDSVSPDLLFVIPKSLPGLVAEYNRLVDAADMLDKRIAWMEATDKENFSENEYRIDEVISEIDVELTDEKLTNIKKTLKSSIKI